MDFAKRQLEKYGWSEGQGLGKDSTGIKTAIKPQVKLNKGGLGHDPAQEFTYRWWEDAFNLAASNINIEQTQNGIKVETVTENPEISTVKRAKIKRDTLEYGRFLSGSRDAEEVPECSTSLPETMSDEQLFQACGGLTAHKAARHGHKLSGKLQRVKEQEEALLKSYQKALLSSVDATEKTKGNCDESALSIVHQSSKGKKNKKREIPEVNGTNDIACVITNVIPMKMKQKKFDVDEVGSSSHINDRSEKKDKRAEKIQGVGDSLENKETEKRKIRLDNILETTSECENSPRKKKKKKTKSKRAED